MEPQPEREGIQVERRAERLVKILVFSIDKYSHLGPLFSQYFHAKWPECPYDEIYIANRQPIKVKSTVIHIRDREVNFGRRMRTFLKHHYTDSYLLIMMIDYIPKSANHALLMKSAEIVRRPNIGHVRLRPMPVPKEVWRRDSDFGVIDKRRPYSLSLQPGMWETQLFYDLLSDREGAHHTETHGSTRTKRFRQLFLSTRTHAISHHNWYRHGRPDPIPKKAPWRIK